MPVRRSERLVNKARGTISTLIPDWMISRIPYRIKDHPKALWETEYSGGRWDYMNGSDEVARYGITAGYCHFFAPGGAILDGGSGEGILKDQLRPDRYTRYVGVDLSHDAIEKARRLRQDERSAFFCSSLEDFTPAGMFDAIVFNECLYYAPSPMDVVRKYCGHLNPNGVLVISMFDFLKARKIWSWMDDAYKLRESARCSNSVGYSWTLRVYSR